MEYILPVMFIHYIIVNSKFEQQLALFFQQKIKHQAKALEAPLIPKGFNYKIVTYLAVESRTLLWKYFSQTYIRNKYTAPC